jgi:hypothetical protein
MRKDHGVEDEPVEVVVVVSDPWEFVDSEGSNVLPGDVKRAARAPDHRAGFPLVLELREPIGTRAAEETCFFVAVSDGGEADYTRLMSGDEVECRLIGISESQAVGELPFDVSTWRGRFPAARAQVRMTRPASRGTARDPVQRPQEFRAAGGALSRSGRGVLLGLAEGEGVALDKLRAWPTGWT